MGSRPRNSTHPEPPRAPGGDLNSPKRVAAIGARLAAQWPDAVVELDHQNAYQLLVATILAAQSTDKLINTVTPALFAKYPDPAALAAADPAELEPMIFSTGFYRMKAKHVIGMARAVVERHGGNIPETMEGLVDLPGVARKTANVVLGSALGKNEGVVVDTHVSRLAPRLGFTAHIDPVKIEQDLMALVPRDQWSIFAHRLIWHGRRVCHARKPDCEHCTLAPLCPSAGLAAEAMPPRADRDDKRPSRAQQATAAAAKPAGATPARAANAIRAATATRPATPARPSTPAKPTPARPSTPTKPSSARPSAPTKPAAARPSTPIKHAAARPSTPARPASARPSTPAKPTPARPSTPAKPASARSSAKPASARPATPTRAQNRRA
jgi:endonuclease III